jgi:hypothetical protein
VSHWSHIFIDAIETSQLTMESERTPNDYTSYVSNRLLGRIADLEHVKTDLEQDVKQSSGPDRERNQHLLDATLNLLNELRKAEQNIHNLRG